MLKINSNSENSKLNAKSMLFLPFFSVSWRIFLLQDFQSAPLEKLDTKLTGKRCDQGGGVCCWRTSWRIRWWRLWSVPLLHKLIRNRSKTCPKQSSFQKQVINFKMFLLAIFFCEIWWKIHVEKSYRLESVQFSHNINLQSLMLKKVHILALNPFVVYLLSGPAFQSWLNIKIWEWGIQQQVVFWMVNSI